MENKTITIYELMGLIKDNKAPYEVIYQGTKYYIDKLENYYRSENNTPLFERIFDNYEDYLALHEKVKILPEENEMKEMVYQKEGIRELLYSGTYKDYEFYILNLGTHPTAYVNVIDNPLLRMKNYNDININVHGGLTYSSDELYINDTKVKGWFIGWDYAHVGDYHGYLTSTYLDKKWTTEEIFEDVKDVIDQCINYEEIEENDEWEDIEEIKHNGKHIYNVKNGVYNTLNSKEKNIFIPLINQLIKNQKYLKERLDKNGLE